MIAALYGRTSKEKDDTFSVSSQIDATSAYAKTNGFTVPTDYVFRETHTGRVLDRPELAKLRELIHTKQIQAVVVYATDRLARRTGVGEILLDEMYEYGVQLHIVQWGTYIKNIPEDRLRFNFETTFSSFERDKFMERSKRGMVKRASLGFVRGNENVPFGYKHNASRTNFEFTEHAPIVAEVLRLYIDGWRNHQIFPLMQEKGYPTPGVAEYEWRKSQWDAKLADGIVTQEQYDKQLAYLDKKRGRPEWNFHSVWAILRKHKLYSGKYTYSIHGESFTVDIPALITEEESQEIAKKLRESRWKTDRKDTPKYNFLMARRLRCAICGNVYSINYNNHGMFAYRCRGKSRNAYNVCKAMPVKRDLVDNKTKEFIKELLLSPRNLFNWWEEQNAHQIEEAQNIDQQVAAVQRLIDQTTQKYHRILDRLTDALDADEVAYYTQQRDSTKVLIAEYREELATLQEKTILGKVSEEVVRDFVTMGEEYRHVLETSEDFAFWRGLVDDLDIIGLIGEQDGRRYIEFSVFGKTRRRFYLTTEPNDQGAEQWKINFSPRSCSLLRPTLPSSSKISILIIRTA